MGIGDELMAAGEARQYSPAKILDKNNKPRWHPIWDHCPDVDRNAKIGIKNGGNARPYIDYTRTTKDRWAWKEYKPIPARLDIKPAEGFGDYIFIEPTIKQGASPNKLWPYWKEFAQMRFNFLQCGPRGTKPLPGVRFIETNSIVEAISIMAGCSTAVLPEGGMHHAAAAMGLSAVVLYGAFISPMQTGYELHKNLFVVDPAATGWRVPNRDCQNAWVHIPPERVLKCLE